MEAKFVDVIAALRPLLGGPGGGAAPQHGEKVPYLINSARLSTEGGS